MKNHAILGLRPGASAAEIKRAYRKLAMRWHPDRNAHPKAGERFAQIRGAYELLLSASERAATRIDQDPEPSAAPEPSPAPSAAPAAESALPRAGDLRQNLVLSLEEAAQGCSKTLSLLRSQPCRACAGSGEGGPLRTHFCRHCHGSGRVVVSGGGLASCGECQGKGVYSRRVCGECQGSGCETRAVALEVLVPPAMLAGDELRLVGQGEPGDEQHQPGDLFLTLVIRAHPLYRRRGRDLHCVMPVSAFSLLTGDDIDIPLLGGQRLCHRLDPGPPEARDLHFAGRGYPGRQQHLPGSLHVRLQPVFPKRLDARQRALLQQADAALRDDPLALPEVAAWKKAHFGE